MVPVLCLWSYIYIYIYIHQVYAVHHYGAPEIQQGKMYGPKPLAVSFKFLPFFFYQKLLFNFWGKTGYLGVTRIKRRDRPPADE